MPPKVTQKSPNCLVTFVRQKKFNCKTVSPLYFLPMSNLEKKYHSFDLVRNRGKFTALGKRPTHTLPLREHSFKRGKGGWSGSLTEGEKFE